MLIESRDPARWLAAALHNAALVVAMAYTCLNCGCGQESDRSAVHGRVTIDGTPITTGRITFYPPEGRSSVGAILADGTYELKEGALVGSHAVTIESFTVEGGEPTTTSIEDEALNEGFGFQNGPMKVIWHVPEKFSSKSQTTLSAEVEPDRINQIDFDL